jgi:hypothetical protein
MDHAAMTTSDLLPCPFCGEGNLRVGKEYFKQAKGYGYIKHRICHEVSIHERCGAVMYGNDEESVILLWNTRK